VLIPEVPFEVDGPRGFLEHLLDRIRRRGHAVIVAAEGAGQHLMTEAAAGVDASGNRRLNDIGLYLRERITSHFAAAGVELNLKYIDPSYAIRSVEANPFDSVYCLRLAQNAVHAALAGRTAMVVGRWRGRFVHLPMALAVSHRNEVEPSGDLWLSELEATGQPRTFG
jgi:6-phosphofructokinase 1